MSMDHFYMGHYGLAFLKLLTPLILVIIGILLFLYGKKSEKYQVMITGKVIELASTMIIIIWWWIDWGLILNGYYNDGNGIPLYDE
jgi:predicted membrane protein